MSRSCIKKSATCGLGYQSIFFNYGSFLHCKSLWVILLSFCELLIFNFEFMDILSIHLCSKTGISNTDIQSSIFNEIIIQMLLHFSNIVNKSLMINNSMEIYF